MRDYYAASKGLPNVNVARRRPRARAPRPVSVKPPRCETCGCEPPACECRKTA